MTIEEAKEVRDILNSIEHLKEFVDVLSEKVSIYKSKKAKIILEIDDTDGSSDNDGVYEPSNPIRIELSDRIVDIIKLELIKELRSKCNEIYKIGEDR